MLVCVVEKKSSKLLAFNHCTDVNPLYTGGLFQCYMMEEPIFHFRDVGSFLLLLLFLMEKLVGKQCRP